jgi:hypothetical protein
MQMPRFARSRDLLSKTVRPDAEDWLDLEGAAVADAGGSVMSGSTNV